MEKDEPTSSRECIKSKKWKILILQSQSSKERYLFFLERYQVKGSCWYYQTSKQRTRSQAKIFSHYQRGKTVENSQIWNPILFYGFILPESISYYESFYKWRYSSTRYKKIVNEIKHIFYNWFLRRFPKGKKNFQCGVKVSKIYMIDKSFDFCQNQFLLQYKYVYCQIVINVIYLLYCFPFFRWRDVWLIYFKKCLKKLFMVT